MFRKIVSCVVVFCFLSLSLVPLGGAQTISALNLPIPGAMVHPSSAFVPVLLKGMTLHPEDPFRFDFIVDSGHTDFDQVQLQQESERLVKYFMAAMTTPQSDLWVNLSPNEPDRIIPQELSKTELGRELLAQDYLLKQLTATLMYPEDELGEEFWTKIYAQAQEQFGTKDIPTETFHKVWILPESASVYEYENTVYVVDSKLKVMMEEDYLSLEDVQGETAPVSADKDISTEIMRDIMLPAIEKEVNEGKNFASLRQIYHSLILAKWYKQAVKNSLLESIYINQNKVGGIDEIDMKAKEEIYEQYMTAYKKGVYDFMKEEYDAVSQKIIPRKYFSGGFKDVVMTVKAVGNRWAVQNGRVGEIASLSVDMQPQGSDAAMLASEDGVSVLTGVGMDYQITNLTVLDNALRLPGDHPIITSLGVIAIGAAGLVAAYKVWSRYTVRGNIRRLVNSAPNIRRSASEALGKFGDLRAVKPLLARLSDGDFHVRRSALKALERLGTAKEQIFQGYLDALRSPYWSARSSAAKVLGEWGDLRAVEPLLARLSDGDFRVRRSASEALGKFGDLRVVEPLLARLSDNYSDVRISAHQALESLGVDKEEMGNGYLIALKSRHYSVRDSAVKELGELEDKRAVEPLLEMLLDSNSDSDALSVVAKALVMISNTYEVKGRIADRMINLSNEKYNALSDALHFFGDSRGNMIYIYHPAITHSENRNSGGYQNNIEQIVDEEAYWEGPVTRDSVKKDAAQLSEVGGIDLNNIDIENSGTKIEFDFDPAMLQELQEQNIQGFRPVMINFTPLSSILPLLGLDKSRKLEIEVSRI